MVELQMSSSLFRLSPQPAPALSRSALVYDANPTYFVRNALSNQKRAKIKLQTYKNAI